MQQNNWNGIVISALTANCQTEITRFYNIINSWLMYTCREDEEIANDIFLKLLSKVHLYRPERGKFHNFVYTLAINEFKITQRPKKKKINMLFIMDEPSFQYPDIIEQENENDIDYTQQLDNLLLTMSPKDREFIHEYIHGNIDKTGKDRKKFLLLKKTLKLQIK